LKTCQNQKSPKLGIMAIDDFKLDFMKILPNIVCGKLKMTEQFLRVLKFFNDGPNSI